MNSSTSSSERRPSAARFLAWFVGAAALVGLSITALLVLLDPYDTGRMTPFVRPGIPDTGPRMANASRMRNTAFDAAIIGNSTIQLISPERLDALTGRRFVQLSTPGTGPMEHEAMARRLFAVRGSGIKTLVVGMEDSWCDASRERRTVNPFPFWLYDNSPLVYLTSLIRMDTVEFLPRRIRLLAGRERLGRADGYWDYEAGGGYEAYGRKELPLRTMAPPTDGRPAATRALEMILASAPPETDIVIVHPPIFVHSSPPPRAEDIHILAECKAALRGIATRRPRTSIVDFWVDSALTRDRRMFFDHNHYRQAVAKHMEPEIAAALRR
jgi:hypothetical protein